MNSGLWLVESDHVTLILVSDWAREGGHWDKRNYFIFLWEKEKIQNNMLELVSRTKQVVVHLDFKLWNFLSKTRKDRTKEKEKKYESSSGILHLQFLLYPEEQLFPDLKFNIKWDTDTGLKGEREL